MIFHRTISLPPRRTWVLVAGAVLMLSACDSDVESPMKPSPTIVVQPTSTATQLDQIAIRVQVRMQVTSGLTVLADAVRGGQASAEVCADVCNTTPLVPGPVLGLCDTAVGNGVAEIAAAWLDDGEVGVDFCVPTTTTAETYTITVSADSDQSNAVTTACGLSGAFLACGSG